MEPLDPARNDDSSGFSKRRISSILKAPRKSIRFPDPEQQENVVECAKPVEKRNSRRVSFAPANDVLLFSKDVKNASPARNPFQELITTAAATQNTQNRVQVPVPEGGIQQILGMETLLNAPLHASQQKDKIGFDTGDDFGEKTVMFSTDDALMDMTHSHTINIAGDAELLGDISLQNYDILPNSREKTVMFAANDGSMDMTLSHTLNMTSGSVSLPTSRSMDLSVDKRNTSSSAPSVDPGFKNFLSNLFKPSGASIDPVITKMMPLAGASSEETNRSLALIETQRADVDKENKAPASVSAVMGISLNTSRKICESSHGNALYPKDDMSMDMTEVQTGRIQGFTDDDDPLQCLFPTQEMYDSIVHSDKKVSQTLEETKQQQRSKTLASSNPKDMTSLKNPSLHASHQGHKISLDTKDEASERNQNRTCEKTASSLEEGKRETRGPRSSSANCLDPGFNNFCASLCKTSAPRTTPAILQVMPPTAPSSKGSNSTLSQRKTDADKEDQSLNTTRGMGESFNGETICPENDVSMDMTETQTGRIIGLTSSDDPFQFLLPTHDLYSHRESPKRAEIRETSGLKDKKALGSSNSTAMETSLKPSLKTMALRHQVKFDAEDDCREKTVRFSADDACMDVTQSYTVHIATDLVTQDMYPQSGHLKKAEMTSRQQHSEALGSSNCKGVETSLTGSLKMNVQRHQAKFDTEDAWREKTVRFTAEDACMDVTRSHTVNIVSDLKLQSHQNLDSFPTYGEKTVRFTANDAAMDVTRSHTVNIATELDSLQSHQSADFLPACGEKTVRFTANDAAMDVTQSHTVNIVSDLGIHSHQNVDVLPACGEKTVRFTANDAAMDVTGSHTVNIATNIDMQSHQNVDFLPACGDQTERFTANDAAMDVTQSHTVNIVSNSVSVLPQQDSNILSARENMGFPLSAKKRENETYCLRRSRSSSAHTLDPGFKNSLSKMSGLWANPIITKAVTPAAPFPQEIVDKNGSLDQLKTHTSNVDTEKEVPGFVPTVMENPVNKIMTDCSEDSISMDMTEAQTGYILEQTSDEPPQCLSSTQDTYPSAVNKTEVTSPQTNAGDELGLSNADNVEIKNRPDSLDSNETNNRKKPKPINPTCSPGAVDHDSVSPQKSRRMSLADLHSKVRRLSHMINTAPDTTATDSCTASLPQLEPDMDKNFKDKTKSPPVIEHEPEADLVNNEENTQAQCLMEEKQPSTTAATPFNLKTQQLMSRLSVGGFKPKLPQRSKPGDSKRLSSAEEHTRTITANITNQLNNFDEDVSDIYDEELGSFEDTTEILDARSPQKVTEKVDPSQEFYMDGPLLDDVFEQDSVSGGHGKKRPLSGDKSNMEDEKRMKASTEMTTDIKMGLQSSLVECDSNFTTAPCTATQTTDDYNSSRTASIRCEATFESTFKQSLFESQLEDYSNDMQRKFDDGTITVLEFFKLFNIDFVIHNPRQSVLPGRPLSDTDCTPMDLLKDKHINYPKQMVYETNVLSLTEKVEGLKDRMQDLEKPLRIVNRPLWEDIRNASETELKTFGAKLKERNNLFRKMSKVQSHEMKEVLYSNLVQANLEEQQSLRGTIEKADEMIKSLDDCIRELETEIAAVEETGFKDTPSLKSLQEEKQKVTEAVADNERQTSELEMQKKQNLNKLNRLKAETRNLENHITALHTVNEWKFGEKRENCTVYTFLHETLHLQLGFEKFNGNNADNQSEKKISHITFKHHLNDEKSQDHVCLVHKLLSQYIEGEAAWVEKYPTSRHVPKLLHDVGLVVSRCRLLGEELRLLKMWGSLKLDILSISCVDTQVHIVFSSLKKFSKFEVTFSVSLTNHLCVLQVQSFKNLIGSTKIQQIEEIVASFSPAKNLLTKIVKKIHKNLLC